MHLIETLISARLEILDLSRVTFLNTCFPNTEEITVTFPVLKVLTVYSAKLVNVKVVNLNVPALRSCNLYTSASRCVPDDSHDLLIKICGQVLAPLENLRVLLPSYSNLVQLKISGYKVFDGTIMAFLRSSPVLETLIFETVVKLVCIGGATQELDLAKFFLTNAMVSEVMIINASSNLKYQAETKFQPVKKWFQVPAVLPEGCKLQCPETAPSHASENHRSYL
ncbi:hypothetical protein RHMOL_Rhmol07G0104300 [Rhododendron molle]|uniref:Uncharacterized protein n=1 Tax=Rhododendron molle TaxID=49168 RepID=A0ACC0MYY8_RHOML|nr:hypothetical protein RHMOL_Rhmol07G0104300 [Rhododendron molle]